MKTNQPINIDLLQFVKTGHFDFLQLGQTREWVLNNFPNPDGFENGANWKNGAWEIFSYGDIELHFHNDKLYQIFADFTDYIDSGLNDDIKKEEMYWLYLEKNPFMFQFEGDFTVWKATDKVLFLSTHKEDKELAYEIHLGELPLDHYMELVNKYNSITG